MSLYTLTTGTSAWTIKKFDEDYNLESEYDVDEATCTCPRADKPSCRHRQMFTEFFHRDHVDDGWFLEFDANGEHKWHPPAEEAQAVLKEQLEATAAGRPENLQPATPPSIPSRPGTLGIRRRI